MENAVTQPSAPSPAKKKPPSSPKKAKRNILTPSAAAEKSEPPAAAAAAAKHPHAAALKKMEADAVEILVKRTRELEDECERLRKECERAAGSFKLAWQEERAAHQRDLEAHAAAKALEDEATRKLTAELKAAKDAIASNERRIDELSEAAALASSRLASERSDTQGQLRSMQRQLAKARAEKGALCEEFSSKLAALADPQRAAPSTPHPQLTFGSSSSSTPAPSLSGYEALSVDPSQLHAAMQQAASSTSNSSPGRQSSVAGDAADSSLLESGSTTNGILVNDGTVAGSSSSGGGGGGDLMISEMRGVGTREERAIQGMRLAQQLRNAEGELEKASRLHQAKARRVNELLSENEQLRLQASTKVAACSEAEAAAEKAKEEREVEVAKVTMLTGQLARLQIKHKERGEEIERLNLERMRLAAQIDTLELQVREQEEEEGAWREVGGGGVKPTRRRGNGGAAADAPASEWRPPLHPASLLGSGGLQPQKQKLQRPKRGGGVGGRMEAATCHGWGGGPTAEAGQAPGGGGAETARSEASTVSDAEWPDELVLG